MSSNSCNNKADNNNNKQYDQELLNLAQYINNFNNPNKLSVETAYYCLIDSIACAVQALEFDKCTRHLGPVVENTLVPNGSRVIGTNYILDPIKATYDNGVLIRWLDYNDTWLAAEWGHPSDNLASILSISDYICRNSNKFNNKVINIGDLLLNMIKAHEVQGCMALENSFNRVGLDHVILVKLASAGVVTKLLGGDQQNITDVLSQVFVDGNSLRTYRHAPNTGSRKSWAAGDAAARAVNLAMLTLKGECGYPSALSAKTWGFYDVNFHGNKFKFPEYLNYSDMGNYVMENVLFKISFPAEFHAQTAAEAAILLHNKYKDKLSNINNISKIELTTQEPAVRIISKNGMLHNPADRDHCLQYIVAVGLLYGELTAKHYEDNIAYANNNQIDNLRECMTVSEDKSFTKDYYDPNKRSIANSVKIYFNDGSESEKITIDYPVGHKNRRAEGIPLLKNKFKSSITNYYNPEKADNIINKFTDFNEELLNMPVDKFMDDFVV